MRIGSPTTQAQAESARLARIAWLLSFAVTVAVITGLLLIKSAQAAAAPAPVASFAGAVLIDDAEEEDEGFEFEEFDEGEDEDEFEEGPEETRRGEPPAECGLRTARGAVVADESRAALSTQVSYTSYDPVEVAIELQLNGRGSLTLWRDHKRLGETGVVRASERLGKGQLAKVLAARNFTLTIKVLDAPRSCSRYFDRHLKTRRAVGDQVTWMQSDSVFGG
ncbi:MAG TPA: hypothetical protein VMS60_10755 [Solirubrobacterales bacterium]|nr:hypothetical protein [Solirubrobacterales bacterium]